jgi:hypothetical protein
MYNYSHTERTPEDLKGLFQQQSDANPQTFPPEVLNVVSAAIDAFPVREPAPEGEDDGWRLEVTANGTHDVEHPERSNLYIYICHKRVPLV